MLSALDRRDRPPEEGAAAGLQGFAVDKTFLSSLKGILLETELVFGIILVSVFAYDAFKIYQTEIVPRATQGDQQ
ncbi:PREDICTED: CKLF-like MARVEL transmembrane domain-containing protein 5 isoform X3 [Miniopterus natalensis]|uniref:CKLF-like MARVEL transmembrane domain-containing protein 5 isoform X3 n=1 Tax=Miniopterus natalensis TaxID=291302 RepID=UPI0007A6EE4D|nr:PREDICTED: CKLF-like MARVEL transmembrane domain-containing protein 5 isoform X3 [Miniopterus natalensis]XP_016078860.1 PREDICTED: CKLF-like MARVEL transmembrane domain-containing protein 5 isoform X3 [Miniopterus natalensis]